MRWPAAELPNFTGSRGEHLDLVGGGKVVGATVGSLRYRELAVAPNRLSLARKTTFVDCRFVDWRLSRAALYGVSFERCVFERMRVPWVTGIDSMIDCRVDGVFRALLSGRRRIAGNDFSRAIGVDFIDGVAEGSNSFAADGSQLLVSRVHPHWGQVTSRAAEGDPAASNLVKNLQGRQAWKVFYKSETAPDDWAFLSGLFGTGQQRSEPSEEGLMPSFGHGQLGFLAVPDDEVAWRRAHDVRPAPLFDVQLTPSGLYLLGEVLGLARSETCALVREDDGRALWRLGEALMAALSKVTEEQPVLRDWDERVAALEEGEWADDSRSLFEHLLRLASGRSDGRAYALFIA